MLQESGAGSFLPVQMLCQGCRGQETSGRLSPAEKLLPQTFNFPGPAMLLCPPSLRAGGRDKPEKAKWGPGSAVLEWRLEMSGCGLISFFSSPSQAAELGMASAYYTYIFTNLVRSFCQLFLPECGFILMGADPPDPWDPQEGPCAVGREGGHESKGKILPNNIKNSHSKSSSLTKSLCARMVLYFYDFYQVN